MKKIKIPSTRLAKKIPTAPPIMAPRLVSLELTVGCCVAESLRISEWNMRGTLLFLPALLVVITTILTVVFSNSLRPEMMYWLVSTVSVEVVSGCWSPSTLQWRSKDSTTVPVGTLQDTVTESVEVEMRDK